MPRDLDDDERAALIALLVGTIENDRGYRVYIVRSRRQLPAGAPKPKPDADGTLRCRASAGRLRSAISALSCSIIRANSALGRVAYFARRSATASSIERCLFTLKSSMCSWTRTASTFFVSQGRLQPLAFRRLSDLDKGCSYVRVAEPIGRCGADMGIPDRCDAMLRQHSPRDLSG
jgi:hypothetical protein